MPKVALADTLEDWEGLLRAAETRTGEFPHLARHIEALRADLDHLRQLDALRLRLTAERQAATQRLHEVREHGMLEAIQLRHQIRSDIGPRSEALTEFGIHPLRKR